MKYLVLAGASFLLLISVACGKKAQEEKFSEGKRLFDQEDYAGAEKYFEGQIAAAPADEDAYYWAGRSAAMGADYAKAETHLKKGIELNPENSLFYDWLGRIYGAQAISADLGTRLKMAAGIKKNFEKAVELDPNNHEAKSFLAIYYFEAPKGIGGDPMKGKAIADEFMASDPVVGHRLMANFYKVQKQADQCIAELNKVIELAPEEADSYSGLATFLSSQKRFDETLENFHKALEKDADHQPSLFGIGQVAIFDVNATDEGIQSLEKLVTLPVTIQSPNMGMAQYFLGVLYERQGMKDKAMAAYEKAVAMGAAAAGKPLEALKAPPTPAVADQGTTESVSAAPISAPDEAAPAAGTATEAAPAGETPAGSAASEAAPAEVPAAEAVSAETTP